MPGAAVEHAEAHAALARGLDGEPHLLRRAARFVGVLQQVDQRLLHLRRVEAARARRAAPLQLEGDDLPQLGEERPPLHLPRGRAGGRRAKRA